jgi:hypothetical protein
LNPAVTDTARFIILVSSDPSLSMLLNP